MKIFKMDRSYTPGMITALCQFAFSTVMIVLIIKGHMVEPWQYIVAFIALVILFVCAQSQVAATNGLEYRKMPKLIRANIKTVRNN